MRESTDGALTFFDNEEEAALYLTDRWRDDSPTEITRIIQAGKADLENQGEDPALWWNGISATELVDWLVPFI